MSKHNLAMRFLLILALGVTTGCTERNPAACLETTCPDPDRPFCDVDGIVSGEENACIAVDCMAGAFEACRGDRALVCNSTGNSYDLVACEFGCSNEGGGCNLCNTSECEKRIIPKYVPNVCSQLAEPRDLIIAADSLYDTDNDSNCTSVIAQANGPAICVVHVNTFRIETNRTLSPRGSRVLAIVADREVAIAGALDVSSVGDPGPGGGFVKSGTNSIDFGGGGAGYRTPGGSGADNTTNGAAINGGPAGSHPSALAMLLGGASPIPAASYCSYAVGGGGVTLISCRDSVNVSGVINAGGGGGAAQLISPTKPCRAGGGGSGGTIVLQGMRLDVTGRLFANGGGGGGNSTVTVQGQNGDSGPASTTPARGGIGATGDGGAGGALNPPGNGRAPGGGGGGAAGYILTYAAEGATDNIAPAAVSPPLESHGIVPTN